MRKEAITQEQLIAAEVWRIVMPFAEQLEEMNGIRLPIAKLYDLYDFVEEIYVKARTRAEA